VRAIELLRTVIDVNLASVHRRRLDAVWRAVRGLVIGGQLCLTGLGRTLPGSTTDKHRIKAVDRLLGNHRLHQELKLFYRAIARWMLNRVKTPVIAVDWTGVGPHHYELSAKLCSDGRALPFLSLVFTKPYYASGVAHQRFLQELANVLPDKCKPIIVTDAGFYYTWFDAVLSFGWDYVGRVRGSLGVFIDGTRYGLKELHRLAESKPKELGNALLGSYQRQPRRMVLSQEPRLKGRRRVTSRGTRARSNTDLKASKGAREPWVLVTSLRSSAQAVVQVYGMRMQIEQSFRDRKSYRNGWSLRLANTRSHLRIEVLLLIASLAEISVQLAGRAVATTFAANGFQANTTRNRRVLSFFFLGTRALRTGIDALPAELTRAMAALLATVHENAQVCTA
jgi:hypothetical protein